MQAQDLGFERARDHRRRLVSRSSAQGAEPREARQHPATETAARSRQGAAMDRPTRRYASLGELEHCGVWLRCNACAVGIAPRGRGGSRRHYEGADRVQGTLMRHFLHMALAPDALARSMSTRATVATLVALRGTVQRLAPAHPRTLPGTVLIAAVAVPTDAHLLRAAPATVQPI